MSRVSIEVQNGRSANKQAHTQIHKPSSIVVSYIDH